MNSRYRWRLKVTQIRKIKRVYKSGQYFEVYECACVYLKIEPNQLSKGTLYYKMMLYGIKLSTTYPSETNDNFVFLKVEINHCFVKKTCLQYSNDVKIFCIQNNIGLNYFASIRFSIVLFPIDRQK